MGFKNNFPLFIFSILFLIVSLSPIIFTDAHALPINIQFDDQNQELCYFENELNGIEVNGTTGQINLIRQLTDKTLQEISSQTLMEIIATDACQPTDPVRNIISTADLIEDFRDGL